MPVLSFNSPRNRATIIAALLIVEFMAILWLRDSSPTSGDRHVRRSLYNPGSSHDRYQVHDDLYYRQQMQHNNPIEDTQSIQYGGNIGEGKPHRIGMPKAGVYQDSKIDLRVRVGSLSESGAAIKEEHGSHNGDVKKQKSTKSKNSNKKKQHHHHHRRQNHAHAMNQRGGFKSTEERKLAQLMPAMDENGVVIEDYFISPRDTDGDGIPDTFVLLRPSTNSNYMMDVGLFDDVIAASVNTPAPVPVASTSIPSPAQVPASPSAGSNSVPPVNVVASVSTPNE
ncbi:hypothetical protein BGZ76_000516 [Entomortierella beljakovae]|nr:hypothetical protein BGZ76_000516 [Entomortierella beljakovae]